MTDFGLPISPAPLPARSRAARVRRRGFSFVEVLFAVMILGIGFIMIAGIFPVAISQTEANGQEGVAATLAREGVNYVQSLPPGTFDAALTDALVHTSDSPGVWNQLASGMVLAEDARYAWVPLYRRPVINSQPAPYAQVIIIGVQVRNKSGYDRFADPTNGTFAPKPVQVTLKTNGDGSNGLDTATFTGTAKAAVAPGTFVVISNDTGGTGQATGYLFRVGNNVSGDTWDLAPGNDMKASPKYQPTGTARAAFIIGQAPDATNPNGYGGGAQDISAYSTFVLLH